AGGARPSRLALPPCDRSPQDGGRGASAGDLAAVHRCGDDDRPRPRGDLRSVIGGLHRGGIAVGGGVPRNRPGAAATRRRPPSGSAADAGHRRVERRAAGSLPWLAWTGMRDAMRRALASPPPRGAVAVVVVGLLVTIAAVLLSRRPGESGSEVEYQAQTKFP